MSDTVILSNTTEDPSRLYFDSPFLSLSGENLIDGKIYSAESSSEFDDIWTAEKNKAYRLFNGKFNKQQFESAAGKVYGDTGDWFLCMKKTEEKTVEGTHLEVGDGVKHHLGYPWVQYNFPSPVRLEKLKLFYSNAASVELSYPYEFHKITQVIVCGRNKNSPENTWYLLNDIPKEEENKFVGINFVSVPGQTLQWSTHIPSEINPTYFHIESTVEATFPTAEDSFSSFRVLYALTQPMVKNNEGLYYNSITSDNFIFYSLSEIQLRVSEPLPTSDTNGGDSSSNTDSGDGSSSNTGSSDGSSSNTGSSDGSSSNTGSSDDSSSNTGSSDDSSSNTGSSDGSSSNTGSSDGSSTNTGSSDGSSTNTGSSESTSVVSIDTEGTDTSNSFWFFLFPLVFVLIFIIFVIRS